jgi:hypothetical protein
MGRPSTLLHQLREQIANAEYSEAAVSFCRLLTEEEKPLPDLVHTAIRAAAPFVHVPAHVMPDSNGGKRGVNYDHTILGWRSAVNLQPYLSDHRAALPATQAMWYVPQGLNIWDQVQCEFPGHLAREQEKCDRREPAVPGRGQLNFDGPAWRRPETHFEECEPILTGSVEDRLARLEWSIMNGARQESYGLALGLAQHPTSRERMKEVVLFCGIIDLQDTLINPLGYRGYAGYQNLGHKALRARALIDTAEYLGWDRSREVISTVIPDLGCWPRLYYVFNEMSSLLATELPQSATLPQRGEAAMTERELDAFTDALLWGGPIELEANITALFRRGRGLLDVADGLAVGFQRYLVDVVEHPNAFMNPMHAFDYLNVVNSWIRAYDHPHRAEAVYIAGRFLNDTIRFNATFPRDPTFELPHRSEFRKVADDLGTDRLLPALEDAILAQDAPLAGALVDAYLERTSERKALIESIIVAACHFQNDPHVLRNCVSSIEEWTHNRTSRRDDIIRGWVKHQSRYIKRSLTHECFELYSKYFLK